MGVFGKEGGTVRANAILYCPMILVAHGGMAGGEETTKFSAEPSGLHIELTVAGLSITGAATRDEQIELSAAHIL